MEDSREQAKKIILEIIRQAGGVFTNKTNLYKAFYHAHIRYAANNPSLLSTWPIVRMPRGPGIHDADWLIADLVREGWLKLIDVTFGSRTAMRFALTEKARDCASSLSPEEVVAIRYGVIQVKGKTADRVSHDSHDQSRAWNESSNGRELAIYTDAMPDDEYGQLKSQTQLAAEAFADINHTKW